MAVGSGPKIALDADCQKVDEPRPLVFAKRRYAHVDQMAAVARGNQASESLGGRATILRCRQR